MKSVKIVSHKSGAQITPRTSAGPDIAGSPSTDSDVGEFEDAAALTSRGEPVDEAAAREIFLTITNDGDIYRRFGTPVIQNLAKKKAKGVYDATKATLLWGYWVQNALQALVADRTGSYYGIKWNEIINPATRRAVAKMAEEHYAEEVTEKAEDIAGRDLDGDQGVGEAHGM